MHRLKLNLGVPHNKLIGKNKAGQLSAHAWRTLLRVQFRPHMLRQVVAPQLLFCTVLLSELINIAVSDAATASLQISALPGGATCQRLDLPEELLSGRRGLFNPAAVRHPRIGWVLLLRFDSCYPQVQLTNQFEMHIYPSHAGGDLYLDQDSKGFDLGTFSENCCGGGGGGLVTALLLCRHTALVGRALLTVRAAI